MTSMRLSSLDLKHFRCFVGEKIDLSADLVAIYGRNGAGKTAIFDAIEFGLLGDVGRLREAKLARVLPNLRHSEPAVARINFNEPAKWIEASIGHDSERVVVASGNGWNSHGQFLHEELVLPGFFEGRRESEPLRDLFRATVLLSQQNIHDFILASPMERAAVLARLSGASYFERCAAKAKKVLVVLKRRLSASRTSLCEAAAESEARVRALSLEEKRVRELLALTGGSGVNEDDVVSVALTLGLRRDDIWPLAEEQPVSASAQLAERSARARRDLEVASARLAELRAGLDANVRARQRYVTTLASLTDARQVHVEARAARELAAKRAADTEQASFDLESKRAAATTLVNALSAWLGQSQIVAGLVPKQAEAAEIHANARRQLKARADSEGDASHGFGEAQKVAAKAQRSVDDAEASVKTISSIHIEALGLAPLLEEEVRLERVQRERQVELSEVDERLDVLDKEIRRLQAAIDDLRDELKALEDTHERRARLVRELMDLAEGRECPACGVAHSSLQDLQAAMGGQLESSDSQTARLAERLRDLESKKRVALTQADVLLAQRKRHIEEEAFDGRRRSDIAAKAAALQARSSAQGLGPSVSELDGALSSSGAMLAQAEKDLEGAERARRLREAELRESSDELSGLRKSEHVANLTTRSLTRDLEQARQKLQSAASRLREVPSSEAAAEDAIGRARVGVASLEDEREAQRSRARAAAMDVKRIDAEVESLSDQVSSLEREQARIQSDLDEYERRCKELGLPTDDIGADDFDEQFRGRDARLNALAQAERVAAELDARGRLAESTAARDALESQALDARRQLSECSTAITSLERGRSQVSEWASHLDEQVRSVVDGTVRGHQLEIARCFRSLVPSPFLFDAVTVGYEDDALRIGVRYRGQVGGAVEPRFYLSTAEANTLALAMFLSFGTGSHWCRLNTLLLDDPVQHLDDLDAAALIDTMRNAVIGRQEAPRQVIMSTCDWELYRLIIRKMHLIEEAGRSFSAIRLQESKAGSRVTYDYGGPSRQAGVRA